MKLKSFLWKNDAFKEKKPSVRKDLGKSIYRFLIRLPESVATLTYVALKHTLQEQEAAKEETK
ncbi:hypothetical protein GCM10020331_088350 [Ectobacillus funiculus]